MGPPPYDSDGTGQAETGQAETGQARLGLGSAGLGRSAARAWRAGPWLVTGLRAPRGRAVAVLGLLASLAVVVGFVAASPAAPQRIPVAAPVDPQPGGSAGTQPVTGGEFDGGTPGTDPGATVPPPSDPPTSDPPTSDPSAGPSAAPGEPSSSSRAQGGSGAEPGDLRYRFPISPASLASYGRTHHSYPATDIFAPCGTRVVSPVDGIVLEITRTDQWDPETDTGDTRGGLSVTVLGADGVRYYGSHLATIAPGLQVEDEVTIGEPLGTVGHTGSARGIACHLHFGISPPCGVGDWAVRRGVVYPWPYLDAWRRGEARSPAEAVWRWRDEHPSLCPMSG